MESNKVYSDNLPTNVNISACNEACSRLLVINVSPRHMLGEIVPVNSINERLFEKTLESYVKLLKVLVHIIQMEQCSGLIRPRFKRSCCVSRANSECTIGSHIIGEVVCSTIDVIHEGPSEHTAGSDITYASCCFCWYPVPKEKYTEGKLIDSSFPNTTN
ncbi:Polypeptide N-acetylgalactosaminyltransferase 1, partial [Plecturocebus cupreus]